MNFNQMFQVEIERRPFGELREVFAWPGEQKEEGEHYRWFGYNDDRDGAHEFLEPLETGKELPTLTRHTKPERPKRGFR